MIGDGIAGHFLDSSIVRPMLLGTQYYREYLKTQLSYGLFYISPIIQMEMNRSYLRNVIEFYFTLCLPTIETFSDALTFWSNRYQSSKHKAVQQLVSQVFRQQFTDLSIQNKDEALIILELMILEFDDVLKTQFVNLKEDSTECARGKISLSEDASDFMEMLERFVGDFDDVDTCRSQCRVDQFLLKDYRSVIELYLFNANQLPKNSYTRGFLKIAESLGDILSSGSDACSCKSCERIGDVLIALDAPRNLRLEHTDYAFDYLCPPIQQPNYRHPSEMQILGGG
jgi:hypothetical protein